MPQDFSEKKFPKKFRKKILKNPGAFEILRVFKNYNCFRTPTASVRSDGVVILINSFWLRCLRIFQEKKYFFPEISKKSLKILRHQSQIEFIRMPTVLKQLRFLKTLNISNRILRMFFEIFWKYFFPEISWKNPEAFKILRVFKI